MDKVIVKKPKVSVLMPVYNCADYIREAIESILNQTFNNFEFIIIDDASTDETVSIIKSYTDSRIKLLQKPRNTGHTNSLNYGLSLSKGDYLARMDGDDISLKQRLAKQVLFMDSHPEVIACGTHYRIMGKETIKNVPLKHEDIKVHLLHKTCFGHPTVMLRKSIFDANNIRYDPSKEPAEDYDLWVRLLSYGELANLPDVLLDYRVHDKQISQNRIQLKYKKTSEVKLNMLKYFEYCFDIKAKKLFEKILFRHEILKLEEFNDYLILKYKLIQANRGFFNLEGLKMYFSELEYVMLKDYFLKRKSFSPQIIFDYQKLSSDFNFELSINHRFKLFIKSIIGYKSYIKDPELK